MRFHTLLAAALLLSVSVPGFAQDYGPYRPRPDASDRPPALNATHVTESVCQMLVTGFPPGSTQIRTVLSRLPEASEIGRASWRERV